MTHVHFLLLLSPIDAIGVLEIEFDKLKYSKPLNPFFQAYQEQQVQLLKTILCYQLGSTTNKLVKLTTLTNMFKGHFF